MAHDVRGLEPNSLLLFAVSRFVHVYSSSLHSTKSGRYRGEEAHIVRQGSHRVMVQSAAQMRPRTGGGGKEGYRIDTDDATHEAERVGCISVTLRVSVPRGERFNGNGSDAPRPSL